MLIDTHAHLDAEEYAGEVEQIVQRAKEYGVGKIVTVGTDVEGSKNAISIAEKFENVHVAVGCHPHYADEWVKREDKERLAELLTHRKVVAVGETGLDYFKNYSSKENQRSLFLHQIKLALEYKKPIIIHCRDAHKDMREILKTEMPPPAKGVIHCFSGTGDDANCYLNMGFYISIAGPITYPNAKTLREVASHISIDRLVVETDCPFLPPQPFRGKRNEPAYVKFTADTLAETLGVTKEHLAEQTTKNAEMLFGI